MAWTRRGLRCERGGAETTGWNICGGIGERWSEKCADVVNPYVVGGDAGD